MGKGSSVGGGAVLREEGWRGVGVERSRGDRERCWGGIQGREEKWGGFFIFFKNNIDIL